MRLFNGDLYQIRAIVAAALAVGAVAHGAAHASAAAAFLDFDRGDFVEARDDARKLQTGEGFELACRAGIVIGSYLESGAAAVATLHAALDDCLSAIKLEPARADARVTFAIGVGFEAKRLQSRRYAEASRRLLERAVRDFPADSYAHGALAGWHYTASEAGFFARIAVGASRDFAQQEFETALRIAPDNYPVQYEYVRYLCAGGKRERAAATHAAERLHTQLAPRNHFEAMLASYAAMLESALAAGDGDRLQAALADSEPFREIERWRDVEGFTMDDIDFVLNVGADRGAP